MNIVRMNVTLYNMRMDRKHINAWNINEWIEWMNAWFMSVWLQHDPLVYTWTHGSYCEFVDS